MGTYSRNGYRSRPRDFRCEHETHGILGDALLWCKICGALITPTHVHVPVESEPDSDCWPKSKKFKLP